MAIEFSKNYLVDKINVGLDFFKKNTKLVLGYVAGVLVLGLIISGYFYYRLGLEGRAQKDFVLALEVYNSKVIKTVTDEKLGVNEFKTDADKWMAVDTTFERMYKKNISAGMAPFFLAYRVEALFNLNKLVDAIDVQKELIKKLPGKSALKPYNIVKLALMQIDTKIDERVKEGLDGLTKVGYDSNSSAQDSALYYLGEYYFYERNFKEAANYWNQLVIQFGKNIEYPSIWVELAKPRLKTIVA